MIKIITRIKKSKKYDLNGIFFFALDHVRKNINIYLFNRIIHFFLYIKGVKIGKNVIFNGKPIINRYPNSSIHIDDGCKFNSAKFSISIGLHQFCAFATLGEDSEISFGKNCGASGLKIHAKSKVTIGNNVLLGMGCTIVDNDAHHSDLEKRNQNIIPSRPIVIGDNVFIGIQSVILKGVTIGKNSVIGARSVVFNDIPENCIAAGNPCKVIIKRG